MYGQLSACVDRSGLYSERSKRKKKTEKKKQLSVVDNLELGVPREPFYRVGAQSFMRH